MSIALDKIMKDLIVENMGEFKPTAEYYEAMDMLVVLYKDCSYTSQYIPGSNIELLWDNTPDDVHDTVMLVERANETALRHGMPVLTQAEEDSLLL